MNSTLKLVKLLTCLKDRIKAIAEMPETDSITKEQISIQIERLSIQIENLKEFS